MVLKRLGVEAGVEVNGDDAVAVASPVPAKRLPAVVVGACVGAVLGPVF